MRPNNSGTISHNQWRQTLIFIGGALSTFFENQPFLSDYWWCKIYFYTLNSRIIGGAAAPGALQVWRHCLDWNGCECQSPFINKLKVVCSKTEKCLSTQGKGSKNISKSQIVREKSHKLFYTGVKKPNQSAK